MTKDELKERLKLHDRNLILKEHNSQDFSFIGERYTISRFFFVSYFNNRWNMQGIHISCFYEDGRITSYLSEGIGMQDWKVHFKKKDKATLTKELSVKRV